MMKKLCPILIIVLFAQCFQAQSGEPKVILITLDGLRWQELFGGAVDSMLDNGALNKHGESITKMFGASTKEEAREKLMPFFWSTVVQHGQLYGNRWHDNKVSCTNRYWFSYPGYNEILTGFSDPEIDSNDKNYNKNTTVLEWVNNIPSFKGKVAAFASWDVFPYIINEKRSGLPVNAGFDISQDEPLSEMEITLNTLQPEMPLLWTTVRHDAFTHHYMMEYMKKNKPKLVYISYGETDDFAHDGRYDRYLTSAHQTDKWISNLWDYIQSDPFYKDQTSLIITTDHGRGHSPMTEWKSHGTIYKGAHEIWVATLGPEIEALGEVKKDMHLFQNQIAATVAEILGLEYTGDDGKAGKSIKIVKN